MTRSRSRSSSRTRDTAAECRPPSLAIDGYFSAPAPGPDMLRFVTTNPGKFREARAYLPREVEQFAYDYEESRILDEHRGISRRDRLAGSPGGNLREVVGLDLGVVVLELFDPLGEVRPGLPDLSGVGRDEAEHTRPGDGARK